MSNSSSIHPYQNDFKEQVLAIFDSNEPIYLDPSERAPFDEFLSNPKGNYYVLSQGNSIVGAGGFCEETRGEARIVWLMIHLEQHKEGLGQVMMEYFEEQIKQSTNYSKITLKTAQNAEGFYHRLNYETILFEKDHWAKGLDLYFMEKKL